MEKQTKFMNPEYTANVIELALKQEIYSRPLIITWIKIDTIIYPLNWHNMNNNV